jgi:hypothetical protein
VIAEGSRRLDAGESTVGCAKNVRNEYIEDDEDDEGRCEGCDKGDDDGGRWCDNALDDWGVVYVG